MSKKQSLFNRLVYSNDLTNKEIALCFVIFMLAIAVLCIVVGSVCYYLYG